MCKSPVVGGSELDVIRDLKQSQQLECKEQGKSSMNRGYRLDWGPDPKAL